MLLVTASGIVEDRTVLRSGVCGLMSSASTSIFLVQSATLLVAWVCSSIRGQRKLTVYASPIVDTAEELYRPVADFLTAACHAFVGSTEVEDEMMAFGSGITSQYVLFDDCPGPDVRHSCKVCEDAERSEVMNGGEQV